MDNLEEFTDWQPEQYVPTNEDLAAAELPQTQDYTPGGELSGPPKQVGDYFYGANNEPVGYVDESGSYQNYFNEDGSAAVSSDYDSGFNQLKSSASSLWDWFKPSTDSSGRQQQSFAASIILGAANSALQSMAADKQIKAASDLENQRSSNRIKERTEEEDRLRKAASAMPSLASGKRNVTGLLSRPRG